MPFGVCWGRALDLYCVIWYHQRRWFRHTHGFDVLLVVVEDLIQSSLGTVSTIPQAWHKPEWMMIAWDTSSTHQNSKQMIALASLEWVHWAILVGSSSVPVGTWLQLLSTVTKKHCCIALFGLEPSVVQTSRTIYISHNLGNCIECAYSWIHTEWMTIALVAHTKTINKWYHVIALSSFCMHAYSSNFHCSQESTNKISLLYKSSYIPSMDSMCLWCLCQENCSVIRVIIDFVMWRANNY